MNDLARIKVNGCIPGHAVGSIVTVMTDSEGTPLSFDWRRRLKDAETDGCCEIVTEPEKKETTKRRPKADAAKGDES